VAPAAPHRDDPGSWAKELGISKEAVELYLASEVIDLHVDSFIWHRLLGRDITRRHGRGIFGGRFFGQADLPRLREAEVGGATWVITTNPLREGPDRVETLLRNVDELQRVFDGAREEVAIVRTVSEYEAARRENKHAAFVGIQGGNALASEPEALDRLPKGLLLRITLVHLTSSELGGTSSPLGADEGIGRAGAEFVERLDERRIFVDLAHAGERSFWDAVDVHDMSLPLIVTHTGVSGVHPHWRNLDDEQLRAIARSGGVVGIMYHAPFLGDRPWAGRAETVVRHLEHVRDVGGDDAPALGSDWDGAIITPRDMPTCLELPRLVEAMLRRGWKPESVTKALGGNFLRVLREMRG
jgi:membrane dipeptidase